MPERTVIIDGFSKSFAMTGWRLGYAVAQKARNRCPSTCWCSTQFTCTAEFTQVAAVEALNDSTNAVPAMVEEYRKRRDIFVKRLNTIPGFRCQTPEGAFYAWVNIEDTGMSAEEVQKLLLEEVGVAGIAGAAFGAEGKNYLRFSLVSAAHLLEEALDRMERVSAALAFHRFPMSICNLHKPVRNGTRKQDLSRSHVKMKHLLQMSLALVIFSAGPQFATAQARPYPAGDVKKTYERFLKQIDAIPMYDNHSHPGFADDSDVDAMASPPDESATLRLRDDNPEFVAAAKAMFGYPYDDFKPEHAKWLADKKKGRRNAREAAPEYFDTILDKLNVDICLANRAMMPTYLDPKRASTGFSLATRSSFPFDNRVIKPPARPTWASTMMPLQEKMLSRWKKQEGVEGLPADLAGYEDLVRRTMEDNQKKGGVAIKFEAAYFRSLHFSDPPREKAEAIYANKYHA